MVTPSRDLNYLTEPVNLDRREAAHCCPVAALTERIAARTPNRSVGQHDKRHVPAPSYLGYRGEVAVSFRRRRLTLVPSPNWPRLLKPHTQAVPSARRAIEW